MAVYFSGRKFIGESSQSFNSGRARVDIRVFERWDDMDISSIGRCGEPATCKVEKAEGLSDKSIQTLKGVIESTLGVEGLAAVKSQIENIVGREVQWNRSITVTKNFNYPSPKCGRAVITIYELRREYEVTYLELRRHLFRNDVWDKKWTRILRQETNKHDGLSDIEEYDELCNCPDVKHAEYDGRLCFDLGNLSFRAPFRLKEGGFDVQIFYRVVSFTFSESASSIRALEEGITITIPTEIIPDVLKFLGDIEEEEVEARVFKYVDSGEPHVSIGEMMQSVGDEQVTVATMQEQYLSE